MDDFCLVTNKNRPEVYVFYCVSSLYGYRYRLGSGEYVEVGLDVSQAKNYAIESCSELLATLSDLELITDFATWIFKESPEHFKKVTTSSPTFHSLLSCHFYLFSE
jgi:hypothetical protein